MKSDDIDRIRSIKQLHEKHWLAIAGVVAVGIGTTSSGKVGLIVSVKKRTEDMRTKIPNVVDDVEVEIKETGEMRAF